MYLKTLALPKAQAMPRMNISAVKTYTFKPRLKLLGPLTVMKVTSNCGYDSMNRQIQLTHITHQVTLCAPYLSDIQPPTARSTPPGSEKQAASRAAVRISSPNSPT